MSHTMTNETLASLIRQRAASPWEAARATELVTAQASGACTCPHCGHNVPQQCLAPGHFMCSRCNKDYRP